MGYKIDFKTYEELTTFIDFASDLLLWGTKKFELISSTGAVMNIDTNNYYQAFYINFYSNKTINYINLSYDENGENLVTEPYTVFVSYIKDMYNNWKVYYASEYQS